MNVDVIRDAYAAEVTTNQGLRRLSRQRLSALKVVKTAIGFVLTASASAGYGACAVLRTDAISICIPSGRPVNLALLEAAVTILLPSTSEETNKGCNVRSNFAGCS